MRDYAKIAPQFWIGTTGKKIRKLGAEAQVVAMYLLSSPHANMVGLYHLPVAYIFADTGTPLEGASKALNSLCEAGFCGYDEEAEVIWVYEMAKYQIADALKPGDKQCSGVQNAYDSVPENRFLAAFYDKYATAFHLKTKREETSPFEAPSKPLRSQEQEQEQEQEQKQEQLTAPPASPASQGDLVDGEQPGKHETALQAACRETWKAYATAYFDRYSAEPVRNVQVSSKVKQFVQRIGALESPAVAAFFVSHQDAFYVRKLHDFGLALKDCEKLRTEWATCRQVTGTQARQAEQTSSNFENSKAALAMLRAEGYQ